MADLLLLKATFVGAKSHWHLSTLLLRGKSVHKDLRRHAFSEVIATAPVSVRTPLLPLRKMSGDGQHRLKAV